MGIYILPVLISVIFAQYIVFIPIASGVISSSNTTNNTTENYLYIVWCASTFVVLVNIFICVSKVKKKKDEEKSPIFSYINMPQNDSHIVEVESWWCTPRQANRSSKPLPQKKSKKRTNKFHSTSSGRKVGIVSQPPMQLKFLSNHRNIIVECSTT